MEQVVQLVKAGKAEKLKIAVVGLGNVLFRDEGLGIYAGELLRANYHFDPEIEIIDGGTVGMGLIDFYHDFDQLVLLDTLSVEGEKQPGALYQLNAEALQGLGDMRRTAHEIEVLQTLELSALTGSQAEVEVIAMVPQDMDSVAFGLSDAVREALPDLVATCAAYIQTLGIHVQKRACQHSIDKILQDYQARSFSSAPSL